jgi:hypothetical protein
MQPFWSNKIRFDCSRNEKRSEVEITKQLLGAAPRRAGSLTKFVNNSEQVETALLPAETEWSELAFWLPI